MTLGQKLNRYDDVPYRSDSYPETHPDRLATLGALFGIKTPDVNSARILELGCAFGQNIIPIAARIPGSECVGIDASNFQITEGLALVEEAKLKNVQLLCREFSSIDRTFGEFDYIIAHGVYSWVAPEVQNQILRICRDNLRPNGIAYMSYNTYPGWYERMGIRELMMFHSRKFNEPKKSIRQARALLDFFANAISPDRKQYRELVNTALTEIKDMPDWYLWHDYLEEINLPCLFSSFIEHAQLYQLQYVGDSDLRVMIPNEFSSEIQQKLFSLAPNTVALEQYLDFLRNNAFRRTLLCHSAQTIHREIKPDLLKQLSFAGAPQIAGLSEELALVVQDSETLPENSVLEHIVALCSHSRHREFTYSELNEELIRLGISAPAATLDTALYQALFAGLIAFSLYPNRFSREIAEKPKVHALTVAESKRGNTFINGRHEPIDVDLTLRSVIPYIDGTRDISELRVCLKEILAAAPEGTPAVEIDTVLNLLRDNALLAR